MAKTATAEQSDRRGAHQDRQGRVASRPPRRQGARGALRPRQPTRSTCELPAHDFAAVLRHSGTNAVLTLDIDGNEQLALTKALDIHPIRRNIQHADLLVVRRGEKVTVEVNVVVEGEAAPGTLVTQDANTIEIEADGMSIPEQLTVSVEGAEAGTQFTAGPITLPAGVTLVSDPETARRQRRRRADRRGPRGRGRRRGRRRGRGRGREEGEGEAAEESPADESE